MKDSTKHEISGTAHKIKGAVKQKIGKAVGNKHLEAQGRGEMGGAATTKKRAKAERAKHK